MNSILVTGSSGFIGKHLITALSKLKYNIYGVDYPDGDVVNKSTWDSYPKANVVVHLAAKSFVPDSWLNPEDYIKTNAISTTNALNYCKKNNAKLILLSSYLYGNPISLPIPESAPLCPTNPYALSKKIAEDICNFYCDKYGINAIILRPFNVYGPGQPNNFLIPEIIKKVKNDKVIIIKDLEPKRDFVYIDDLIGAILKVIKTNIIGCSTYNIGSGLSYSVKEIIDMIQKICNTNKPIYSKNERRQGEIMNTVADIKKTKTELGWEVHWSLQEGLLELIKHYK